MGQDSSSWLVFEFKCLASKTTFIASPLGIIIKGFRNVVPIVCFSSDVEPICFIILYFSSSSKSLFSLSLINWYFRRSLCLKFTVIFYSNSKGSRNFSYVVFMFGVSILIINQNIAEVYIFCIG